MRVYVLHQGAGVLRLRASVRTPEGDHGDLWLEIEPREEYEGYTYDELRERIGGSVEVPRPEE